MFSTEANRAAGVEATLFSMFIIVLVTPIPVFFTLEFRVFRQRWRSRKSNTDLIHQFGSGLNLVWKCQCDLCWEQSRFRSRLIACGSTLPHGDTEAFSTCTFFIVVFDSLCVILCVLYRRKWTPVPWYRLCSAAWPTTPTCRRAAKSTKRPRTARKARDRRKNPWRSDHLSAISSFAPCGLWNEWVCVSELVPVVCLQGLVLTGDPPASAR